MGFKDDRALRQPPADPHAPHNVGFTGGEFSATATPLFRKQGGGWQYGAAEQEIEILLIPNAVHELRFAGPREIYWSGIEILIEDVGRLRKMYNDPGRRGSKRYSVVAALEPAAWGWISCAQIFSEEHKLTGEAREQALREWSENGRRLDELGWDPFAADGRGPRARLNDPMRLHYEETRALENGFAIGREPQGVEDAVWHFGVCPSEFLPEFGVDAAHAHAAPRKRSGLARAPRTPFADLTQAAALYAAAGRARGDAVTFEAMQARAEKDLSQNRAATPPATSHRAATVRER